MKSMTGYGYGECQDENLSLTLELKSYNNRYLDLSFNLPNFLSPLEPVLRKLLSKRIFRGRVECSVLIRKMEEDMKILVDQNAAIGYFKALEELREITGAPGEVKLGDLLNLQGVLKTWQNQDIEKYEALVKKTLEGVWEQFETSRMAEGRATTEDIETNLALLEENAAYFNARAADLEAEMQTSLQKRFDRLLEEKGDDNRFMQEVAVMLMKYSIAEEIARLRGHLESFRLGMAEAGPHGKRLDFLCQEMAREVNTIGSKSTMGDVILRVVACKDGVEKIREQLRNLE